MTIICRTLIAVFLFAVHLTFAQDKMMLVHVINVGQGSAALIEFPCGVILVDTGGETNKLFKSNDALKKYLHDFFIRRADLNNTIDLLILTHPHKDHTLGVKEVTAEYRIKNLVTNGETTTGSGITGQKFIQQLATQSQATSTKSDDINFFASVASTIPDGGITNSVIDPINCPGADPAIRLLWGKVLTNPGWNAKDFANMNNHSVVCKIEFGQASILLTGDLQDVAIGSLMGKHSDKSVFDTDVYLVGHHGSKNGTTVPFLQAITPEIAILSFGDYSRHLIWTAWAYGHPNQGIVQMLEQNVSSERTPKDVFIGIGGKKFTHKVVSKAIYGVGWDDSFVLSGNYNGTWTYGIVKNTQ